MTIEMTRVTQQVVSDGGRIFLPEWCLTGLVNSHVPSEAELFTEDSVKRYPLGTKHKRADNTIWRYVRAGAAHTSFGFLVGNYTQCPGKAGNSVGSGFEGGLYASVAAAQTYFDIADTAATKNLYEGALAVLYDTTNGYQQYRVIGNDVSTGVYTRCYIAPPGFKAADVGSPGITVYLSPYYDIRGCNTHTFMSALGYLRHSITSGYHAWMQTGGEISGVTGAGTWPGQTAHYRGVYHSASSGTVGTYVAGTQRVGTLLGRTATDYGDNHFNLELDQ